MVRKLEGKCEWKDGGVGPLYVNGEKFRSAKG